MPAFHMRRNQHPTLHAGFRGAITLLVDGVWEEVEAAEQTQLVFEQDWQHALRDLLNLAVRRTPIPCVVPFALWEHLCQAPEDLEAVASNLTMSA